MKHKTGALAFIAFFALAAQVLGVGSNFSQAAAYTPPWKDAFHLSWPSPAQAEPEPDSIPETSHYTVVRQSLSWSEAKAYAEAYDPDHGSHLATITSEEEWAAVQQALTDAYGDELGYVWLGAARGDDDAFQWVTDEPFAYTDWYPGEPSGDDWDGTPETCLCAWHLDGSWTWNDQRDDLAPILNNAENKLGLVIETYA